LSKNIEIQKEEKGVKLAKLKLMDSKELEFKDVTTEGAEKTKIKWLISSKDGAENFQMRIFKVEPGGKTPLHSHDWEHEIFVLSGQGKLIYEKKEYKLRSDYFALVPANSEHSFVNDGEEPFIFMCLIPVK